MKVIFLKDYRFAPQGHQVLKKVEGEVVDTDVLHMRESLVERLLEEEIIECVDEAFEPDPEADNDSSQEDEDAEDDLTKVKGIGEVGENKLNDEKDVYTFEELAELLESDDGKAYVDGLVRCELQETIDSVNALITE